jgi:hypothetical protein
MYQCGKNIKDFSSFYIHKALSKIVGSVKYASRLQGWSLYVETRNDDQSRKLLRQKLLSSYPVLVGSTKPLAQVGL